MKHDHATNSLHQDDDSTHPLIVPASTENIYTDPVCGMNVVPDPKKYVEYKSKPFYFCSEGCLSKFRAHPREYADIYKGTDITPPKGTIYTCLMHPDVRQVGLGACPKCGMAL